MPSFGPNSQPSGIPTLVTLFPTGIPTQIPTWVSTLFPSGSPSGVPSEMPIRLTEAPSGVPSRVPSVAITSMPIMEFNYRSSNPTGQPTDQPSFSDNASADIYVALSSWLLATIILGSAFCVGGCVTAVVLVSRSQFVKKGIYVLPIREAEVDLLPPATQGGGENQLPLDNIVVAHPVDHVVIFDEVYPEEQGLDLPNPMIIPESTDPVVRIAEGKKVKRIGSESDRYQEIFEVFEEAVEKPEKCYMDNPFYTQGDEPKRAPKKAEDKSEIPIRTLEDMEERPGDIRDIYDHEKAGLDRFIGGNPAFNPRASVTTKLVFSSDSDEKKPRVKNADRDIHEVYKGEVSLFENSKNPLLKHSVSDLPVSLLPPSERLPSHLPLPPSRPGTGESLGKLRPWSIESERAGNYRPWSLGSLESKEDIDLSDSDRMTEKSSAYDNKQSVVIQETKRLTTPEGVTKRMAALIQKLHLMKLERIHWETYITRNKFNAEFKKELWAILLQSKENKSLGRAAANAISILNMAGELFSGLDLS